MLGVPTAGNRLSSMNCPLPLFLSSSDYYSRFSFALRPSSCSLPGSTVKSLISATISRVFRVPISDKALDKYRGNRYDDNDRYDEGGGPGGGSHFRRQFRSYDHSATPDRHHHNHRPHGSPLGFRGGRGGGRRPFDSPPRGDARGFRMFGGGGGGAGRGDRFDRDGGWDFEGELLDLPLPPPPPPPMSQMQLSGQKRGVGFPSRAGGGPPHTSEHSDATNFAKLFVGSVPRNATENDIRPLFEQHGQVIEVAMIKDKRTGQQQGCCFIKFATSDEATRAIRALHNQYTLPGGTGPIQVRYADGVRERLGAFEYKLFVGSLNKQATEKEVEEIFLPYGQVEDVYLMRDEMKQSRGCGFVKYSQREMALAAIGALNGSYTMRGCDQPLTVRFADPKRPRLGDSRLPPHFSEPPGARTSENAWHPRSGTDMGLPSVSGPRDFSGQFVQGSNQPSPQLPLIHRQISPSPNPFHSPQNFPSSLNSQNQPTTSYSQTHTSYPMSGPMPTSFTQPIPPQQVASASQPSGHQITNPVTVQQYPPDMNIHKPSFASQQPMYSPVPQPSAIPFQQSPSPLAQKLSRQTQSLQASLQSSQQVFSQLQQQLQLMQPSSKDTSEPSESQATHLQLNRNMQYSVASSSTDTPGADFPSTITSKCSWTEHMSPDGFQYYYNSVTGESRWVEPDDLKIFKQHQQQWQNQVSGSVSQTQIQSHSLRPHQVPQIQQMQLQPQIRSQLPQQSFQPTPLSSELGYAQYSSAANLNADSAHFQQGVPAAQDWMRKSKQTGV